MDFTEAWVLHARAWRESSQLVELLTPAHGRTGAIARASRGARRRNPLQPFTCYRLQLDGRGELRRIRQVEAAGAPRLLAGHALYAALYLNELLVRLLYRDVPVQELFGRYGGALDALAAGLPIEPVLRGFELALLEELGYGHRWGETVDGEPVAAGGLYTFDPDSGVRAAWAGAPGPVYAGATLLALEAGRLDDAAALREAKQLTRVALARHLGERPLQSRSLFRRPGAAVAEEE